MPRHRRCRHGGWPQSPPRRPAPAAAAIPRWPTARSRRIARPPSFAGRHRITTDTTTRPAGLDGATDLATDTALVTVVGLVMATGLVTAAGGVTATVTCISTGRPVTVTAVTRGR